jgi:hypothetical protein
MAIKCANCENDAHFTMADRGVRPVDYCNRCLPKHLLPRATRGDFKLRDETKKKASKAKAEE